MPLDQGHADHTDAAHGEGSDAGISKFDSLTKKIANIDKELGINRMGGDLEDLVHEAFRSRDENGDLKITRELAEDIGGRVWGYVAENVLLQKGMTKSQIEILKRAGSYTEKDTGEVVNLHEKHLASYLGIKKSTWINEISKIGKVNFRDKSTLYMEILNSYLTNSRVGLANDAIKTNEDAANFFAYLSKLAKDSNTPDEIKKMLPGEIPVYAKSAQGVNEAKHVYMELAKKLPIGYIGLAAPAGHGAAQAGHHP